jgi:hypothetical protein
VAPDPALSRDLVLSPDSVLTPARSVAPDSALSHDLVLSRDPVLSPARSGLLDRCGSPVQRAGPGLSSARASYG